MYYKIVKHTKWSVSSR